MEVINWLVTNWGIVASALTAVGGFLFARKKNKLDLSSQESDNVAKNLQLFQTMLDDSSARFKEAIAMRDEENSLLREQNSELKNLVSELTGKVEILTREVKKLERIIKSLRDE